MRQALIYIEQPISVMEWSRDNANAQHVSQSDVHIWQMNLLVRISASRQNREPITKPVQSSWPELSQIARNIAVSTTARDVVAYVFSRLPVTESDLFQPIDRTPEFCISEPEQGFVDLFERLDLRNFAAESWWPDPRGFNTAVLLDSHPGNLYQCRLEQVLGECDLLNAKELMLRPRFDLALLTELMRFAYLYVYIGALAPDTLNAWLFYRDDTKPRDVIKIAVKELKHAAVDCFNAGDFDTMVAWMKHWMTHGFLPSDTMDHRLG